jgi:drug/metabolite transporter (DMT)-like permease
VLAAALLFAALAASRRPFRVRRVGPVALVGLLHTAGNFGFATWALALGPAGRSVVLCYTMPFWVVLLAWPALGERPSRPQAVAAVIALVGLVLIFASSSGRSGVASALLAALSGVSWAGGALVARRLLRSSSMDPLALTAWQMLFGALALAAAAVAFPERPTSWTPYFVFALGYTVLLATALAWVLWFSLLQRMPAAVASLAVLATPVLSLAFGALELRERPRGLEAAGMALVVAGLAIVGPLAVREARR